MSIEFGRNTSVLSRAVHDGMEALKRVLQEVPDAAIRYPTLMEAKKQARRVGWVQVRTIFLRWSDENVREQLELGRAKGAKEMLRLMRKQHRASGLQHAYYERPGYKARCKRFFD
jgi:hypothetical protein